MFNLSLGLVFLLFAKSAFAFVSPGGVNICKSYSYVDGNTNAQNSISSCTKNDLRFGGVSTQRDMANLKNIGKKVARIKFIKYIKGKLSLGFLKKRLERREERIRKEIEEIIVGYAKSKGLKFLRGKAEDLAVDVIIKKMKLTKGSKKVFEEMNDPFTTTICLIGGPLFIKYNTPIEEGGDYVSNEDFTAFGIDGEENFHLGWKKSGSGYTDWEKKFIPSTLNEVAEGQFHKRIDKDAIFGEESVGFNLLFRASSNAKVLPLEDHILSFNSEEERLQLVKDIKLNYNNESPVGACPAPYKEHVWGDKSSDENFTRFFFHGIGCALLERQTTESSKPELGPIEIDLDFMKNLPVRKGFRPMGVKIYFDMNQKPTGIFDSAKGIMFKPGDSGWEGAKFLARSSAFTLATAREHLICTHQLTSNYMSYASIKHLPPCHPIRRLMNIFTFRTNKINNFAFLTLIPENSILHRSTGFEYDSMLAVFDNAFTKSNCWEPFASRNMRQELLDMSSDGKLPYHSEGVEYYNIVETFVREWLQAAGDAASDSFAIDFYNEIRKSTDQQQYKIPEYNGIDSMVNLLAQGIFTVTAYHEIIGTVIDYTNDPAFVSFRVREDDENEVAATEGDVQEFITKLQVTAGTGLKVPMLMKPFKGYFGRRGAPRWERKRWADFQKDLRKLSKKIQKSDRKKDVQFLFFDPKRFESSVSV